jgi:hypothetical protein
VWRYISVTSLLNILQTETIWFPRITILRTIDPYEGLLPASLKMLLDDKERAIASGVPTTSAVEAHTNRACVNCWHMKDDESAAMWNLYSSRSGVAIQSKVSILLNLFGKSERTPKMALIEYLDFDSLDPDALPALPYPVYFKRKSFDHERELRVVILDSDTDSSPDGIAVKVDIKLLMQRIYISPKAEKWTAGVIRRELERYGLETSVIQSDLFEQK